MINKNSTQINSLVFRGISQMNHGDFFGAHETLELAWRLESHPIRRLYKGLIQLSVACYHTQHKNWVGAKRVLDRARENLTPFTQLKSPLDVTDLLRKLDIIDDSITRIMTSGVTDAEITVSLEINLVAGEVPPLNFG